MQNRTMRKFRHKKQEEEKIGNYQRNNQENFPKLRASIFKLKELTKCSE